MFLYRQNNSNFFSERYKTELNDFFLIFTF